MGHRKRHAPRRGSLGFVPRKRAKRLSGRLRNWPVVPSKDTPRLLGFAGYKAGMTHVAYINNRPKTYEYKKEVFAAVTVIETPPIHVFGIRLYGDSYWGLRVLGQAWAPKLDSDLSRAIKVPEKDNIEEYSAKTLEHLDSLLNKAVEVRVLASTKPRNAGLPKKKPDILEIKVSGEISAAYEYAKELLLREDPVRISEVFDAGQYVDVIGVTKGKGFQGVVKRFGVKILTRKKRKGRRVVGCIGPWHPARVMWTVPRAGQMGLHNRVEYNKYIMKIGTNPEEINPVSGFKRYGLVRSDYVLLLGSVPGAPKRLIRFRAPVRPAAKREGVPEITYISTTAKN